MVAIFSGSRWMSAKPAGMDWLMKMAKLYKDHGADFYMNIPVRGTQNPGVDLGAQFESAKAYGEFMDKLNDDSNYQSLMQQVLTEGTSMINMVNSYECTADPEMGKLIDTSLPYFKITVFALAGPGKMESMMKSTAIAKKLQEAMGVDVSVWRGISGEPPAFVYIEGHKSCAAYGEMLDGSNASDDFNKWVNDAMNDPSGVMGIQTLVRSIKHMV